MRPRSTQILRGLFKFWLLVVVSLLVFDGYSAAKKPAKMKPQPKIPPGKPEIFQLEPRGIQRGVAAKIKLIGTNLIGLTELHLLNPQLKGELLETPPATTNEVWIKLTAATNLARGAYEISVKNTNSESSKLKLYVDDLPQAYDTDPNRAVLKLPISFWGTLAQPGE